MFGKATTKQENYPSNRIDSLVGNGTVIEGDLIFTGGLRIEGEIRGDVSVASTDAGMLVLGSDALINGNVRVTHLVVGGTVNGSVYVTDTVELLPTAKVRGDIHYGTLEMKVGAVIQGHLVHVGDESSMPSR